MNNANLSDLLLKNLLVFGSAFLMLAIAAEWSFT